MFRKPPVPPEGAQLNRRDGTVIPLELRYLGKKRRLHLWEAVLIVPLEDGDTFSIKVVPPRTEVRLGFSIRNEW